MEKKLIIENFERVDTDMGIPYFSYKIHGCELTLEPCFSGYCVAFYDRKENLVGYKTCTSDVQSELYRDQDIALQIANELLEKEEVLEAMGVGMDTHTLSEDEMPSMRHTMGLDTAYNHDHSAVV